MVFRDRAAAGRVLADALGHRPRVDPLVLALPRGGVPVAVEVARHLGAPLDVLVARKVGAPDQPEYGIGAVGEAGTVVVDRAALVELGLDDEDFHALVVREREELERRVRRYRGDRPRPDVRGRDVVLVDDGLATGVTAEAALGDLRRASPRSVVLAVPVGSADTVDRLAARADAVVCVTVPEDLRAVGRWYRHFGQTTDDEVLSLLARAGTAPPAPPRP